MGWEILVGLGAIIAFLLLLVVWVARLQGKAEAVRDGLEDESRALAEANRALARSRRLGSRLRARLRGDDAP